MTALLALAVACCLVLAASGASEPASVRIQAVGAAATQGSSNQIHSAEDVRPHADPAAEDVRPRWYPAFSVHFNESTKILTRMHTTGVWYYDSVGKREAVVRANGRVS